MKSQRFTICSIVNISYRDCKH